MPNTPTRRSSPSLWLHPTPSVTSLSLEALSATWIVRDAALIAYATASTPEDVAVYSARAGPTKAAAVVEEAAALLRGKGRMRVVVGFGVG